MATLTPRKHPSQSRSRVSVDAIIEASAQVLAEGGYLAFNTNTVARRAGVSIGTLYQYFPNKESLLAAIQQRHLDEIATVMRHVFSLMREQDLTTALQTFIEADITAHAANPGLHLVLLEQVAKLGAKGNEGALYELLYSELSTLFEAHREQITVTNLRFASFIVVRMIEGTVHAALAHHPEAIKSGLLARELIRAVAGYLSCEP